MKTNTARAKIKRGESTVGTWLTLSDPTLALLMARTGFDWITVELEHSPTSFESAAQSFAHLAAAGVAPLVRVPFNTTENLKRVLDIGAWGVIVPMVNSRAEAEAVVAATRYPPLGRRSIGGQLHAVNFDTDPATYYARANEQILVVVMAEHVRAIEAADDILSVPGIDVVFIGPNDLHNSMGRAPAFDSDAPEYVQAVQHIFKTARRHGVAPGIHVIDAAAAQRRLKEGWQFIAVASEAGLLLAKAREVIQTLGRGGEREVAKY